jgi:hypothetical protein
MVFLKNLPLYSKMCFLFIKLFLYFNVIVIWFGFICVIFLVINLLAVFKCHINLGIFGQSNRCGYIFVSYICFLDHRKLCYLTHLSLITYPLILFSFSAFICQ